MAERSEAIDVNKLVEDTRKQMEPGMTSTSGEATAEINGVIDSVQSEITGQMSAFTSKLPAGVNVPAIGNLKDMMPKINLNFKSFKF